MFHATISKKTQSDLHNPHTFHYELTVILYLEEKFFQILPDFYSRIFPLHQMPHFAWLASQFMSIEMFFHKDFFNIFFLFPSVGILVFPFWKHLSRLRYL